MKGESEWKVSFQESRKGEGKEREEKKEQPEGKRQENI